ncbi:hypothetical protein Bbelb_323860 [Branchiostoma belcheri]|nr:hypothetical protein Bbelb_323860 [Branchiostoma belcheri]
MTKEEEEHPSRRLNLSPEGTIHANSPSSERLPKLEDRAFVCSCAGERPYYYGLTSFVGAPCGHPAEGTVHPIRTSRRRIIHDFAATKTFHLHLDKAMEATAVDFAKATCTIFQQPIEDRSRLHKPRYTKTLQRGKEEPRAFGARLAPMYGARPPPGYVHVSFSLRKFLNEVRIPIKVRTPDLGLVGDKYSRLKPDLQDVTTASKAVGVLCLSARQTPHPPAGRLPNSRVGVHLAGSFTPYWLV